MRRRLLVLLATAIVLGATVAAFGGCGNNDERPHPRIRNEGQLVHGLTPEQARQPLAKVGPTTITVGEFAEELSSKASFIRTRYNSPERRREFLDQMIRFELLAQEAHRRGYDRLPDVARTRKQMMIRRFLAERFDQGGPESITPDEVRAYYESHQSEFNTPEQVRASHIQVRDRGTAVRLLRELTAEPNNLGLFRQLAQQNNTDAQTRDRFGDLRFFSRPSQRTENEPEVPEAVAEAAFAIDRIGAFAPEPVHSDRGWHIVKLTGRRAAITRRLEEAERPIRNRLWRERREQSIQQLIDHLRAESDVEEHYDLLNEVHLNLPEGNSPTVNPELGPESQGGLSPLIPPTKEGPRAPNNRGRPQ
jgi:peptidyl-prolyl cis-trans isomerase C